MNTIQWGHLVLFRDYLFIFIQYALLGRFLPRLGPLNRGPLFLGANDKVPLAPRVAVR